MRAAWRNRRKTRPLRGLSKRQKLVLPGEVFHKLFPAFTKIQQIVLWNFFHKLWKTGCKTGSEERKNGAAGRFFTLSTGFSTTHRQKFPVYGAYNGARGRAMEKIGRSFCAKVPSPRSACCAAACIRSVLGHSVHTVRAKFCGKGERDRKSGRSMLYC